MGAFPSRVTRAHGSASRNALPPPFPRMSTGRFASLATDLLSRQDEGEPSPQTPHHGSPIVAFIIGLAIILLASILNAAGLNLTKLDHVRCFGTFESVMFVLTELNRIVIHQVQTSAIPKAQRRKDWLRPLWLLGMILYM